MSLFLDFHKFESERPEEVKKAYLKYLGIQAKYVVKYHQFWVLFKRKKSGNIAEIVFEPGFNSPSYFTNTLGKDLDAPLPDL
jgi:AraC-like DNA-binding protein